MFFGRCGVRHGIILFALAKFLLLHLYPLDILHNMAALRCDPRCELPGRIVLAQRFQADEPLAVWMPDRNVFPLFVEPNFISAPTQHIPKIIHGACLRQYHINILTDHAAKCRSVFFLRTPFRIMHSGFNTWILNNR